MTDSIIVTIKGEDIEISQTLIERAGMTDSINRLNDPNLSEEDLYKILLGISLAMSYFTSNIIYPRSLKDKGITGDEDSKAKYDVSRGNYVMANGRLLKLIKKYESAIKETLSEGTGYIEESVDKF